MLADRNKVVMPTFGGGAEQEMNQKAQDPVLERLVLPSAKPAGAHGKPLIEEVGAPAVSSTPEAAVGSRGDDDGSGADDAADGGLLLQQVGVRKVRKPMQTPQHTVQMEEQAGVRSIKVQIDLPGVASAAEVELDISARELALTGAGYSLSVAFGHAIDEAQAGARFKKKKARLIVTAPLL